ncbi:NAD(P)-dependent dehydrogenase, short-chain alcohol dehydrogenase family [Cyclobacterium lianum]|uniref:NAD(P)-dependent dehydrogenase, short-chain alcohol dehydrogenase family n=1 Tax=Cyclobacterium lianum TaxID=388280 RepID=A0A1M7QFG3_9BACT|nr:SDR family NAD(P)-dependent oxidoreductase [Cyclobacterium lianum]SHN29646.1 NAD(P)-dependent dehydrogenase, short-chain alcohol dehydrogenase family [Cyclobacterium lianum]
MKLAITGATSGIGAEKVKALATNFDQVFLLVRNLGKARTLVQSLNIPEKDNKFIPIHCDLADLSSVKKAADEIRSHTDSLDVLINNAGGIFPKRIQTKDQLELTFSANHLGHFLLTKELMPLLTKDQGARIINVSSEAHKAASVNWNDLQFEKGYSSFKAYANAKLFNILFTKSLAEKYGDQKIAAYSLHPGVVNTNFGEQSKGLFKLLLKLFKPFMISPKKGAETGIFLASTPKVPGENGAYFKKSKVARPSQTAESKKLRERLWERSEKLVE